MKCNKNGETTQGVMWIQLKKQQQLQIPKVHWNVAGINPTMYTELFKIISDLSDAFRVDKVGGRPEAPGSGPAASHPRLQLIIDQQQFETNSLTSEVCRTTALSALTCIKHQEKRIINNC